MNILRLVNFFMHFLLAFRIWTEKEIYTFGLFDVDILSV